MFASEIAVLVDYIDTGISVAFDKTQAGRGGPVTGGDGPFCAEVLAEKFSHAGVEVMLKLGEEMDLIEDALLPIWRLFWKAGAAHFVSAVEAGASVRHTIIGNFVRGPCGKGLVNRSIFPREPCAELFLEKLARSGAKSGGLEGPEEQAVLVLYLEQADGWLLGEGPAGVGTFRC